MKSTRKDLAAGQAVYIGVDLHRGSWHITIRTQERVLHTETLPPQVGGLWKSTFTLRRCALFGGL